MSNLWLTIGHLVHAGLAPAPKIVAPEGCRLHMKLRTSDEVDQWVRRIGAAPAGPDGAGEYGSTDFLTPPGWCGYTVVSIYCDLPRAVRTVEEIRGAML